MKTICSLSYFMLLFALTTLNGQVDATLLAGPAPESWFFNRHFGGVEARPVPFLKAATFPGGQKALSAFLQSQLKYPELALDYGVEGVVLLQLTIAPDGSIEDCQVTRGVGYGCDREALRVAKLIPHWEAARIGQNKVRSKIYVPIRFHLR